MLVFFMTCQCWSGQAPLYVKTDEGQAVRGRHGEGQHQLFSSQQRHHRHPISESIKMLEHTLHLNRRRLKVSPLVLIQRE